MLSALSLPRADTWVASWGEYCHHPPSLPSVGLLGPSCAGDSAGPHGRCVFNSQPPNSSWFSLPFNHGRGFLSVCANDDVGSRRTFAEGVYCISQFSTVNHPCIPGQTPLGHCITALSPCACAAGFSVLTVSWGILPLSREGNYLQFSYMVLVWFWHQNVAHRGSLLPPF